MLTRTAFAFGEKIIPSFLRKRFSHLYFNIINSMYYGTTDMFATVTIETITTCNRKCWYCPNSKYKRPQTTMPTEMFKKIIDQLHEIKYRGRMCPHMFGEPLLDKRLLDLLSYARKRLPHSLIKVYTNGDLLTEELFHKFINVGVDGFLITDHDISMVKGEGVTKKKIPIYLFKDKLSKKLQDKIILYKIDNRTIQNRGGLIETKVKRKRKCNVKVLTIDYKGDVILCCNDYFGKCRFGNVDQKNIMEIWNSKGFKSVRKKLRKGIFEFDFCKKCAGSDDSGVES